MCSTSSISKFLEQIGINIILAVGLNLIVGFSGQFSLGHAGFMAIGAYSAAILGSKSPTYGAFFGAMVLGALIAGIVALIVGGSNPSFERGTTSRLRHLGFLKSSGS